MLSKLTIKPLLWACGLLLIAVAGLSGTLLVKDARHDAALAEKDSEITRLTTELTAADGQVETLAKTNATQTRAVESLAAKLNAAIDETEELDALLLATEAERDAAHHARDVALAEVKTKREQDYASDPSCSAWGRAPVCGRITASVLDEWAAAAARSR